MKQIGGCRKSVFSFQFDSYNWWTIEARRLKFDKQIDYKHAYKFFKKHFYKLTERSEAAKLPHTAIPHFLLWTARATI
jgi:hypothetical protein